jgi:hypothetical protein
MKKKTLNEITTKPLKPRLRNLIGKGNEVIQLFIKLYKNKKTKTPLGLNNNNKRPLRDNNQLLKSRLTNLHSKGICVIQLFMTKLKLSYNPWTKDSGVYYIRAIR